jgi:diacylglycerol kinase family enzyme
MKHLFIINPKAKMLKDKCGDFADGIRAFFSNYPQLEYDIHITRWKRDAVGFTRRYVSMADSLVRVYAVGGNGTLFEVTNGVQGLPNVQIAAYPMGINNSFLYTFGGESALRHFRSLRNLVFSHVINVDVMRIGNNFSINASLLGVEAAGYQRGAEMYEKLRLPINFCYQSAGVLEVIRTGRSQEYRIDLDGKNLNGSYLSLTIANSPCYGKGLPGPFDAKIDDGLLDIYLIKDVPKLLTPCIINDYHRGLYFKWKHYISHYRGRSLSISSDTVMNIVFDGEVFYDTSVRYEIVPRAIDFVYPGSITAPEKQNVQ